MKKTLLLLILLLSIKAAQSQILTPVKWAYGAKKEANGLVIVYLKATIQDGWHIYSVNQKPGGPQKTQFEFLKSADYEPVGKVTEPKPESKYEEVFGIQVDYFNHEVIFQQKFRVKKDSLAIKGKLTYMACTNKQCLPPEDISFEIPVK